MKGGEKALKVENGEITIPDNALVEVTQMNNVVEVRYLLGSNNSIGIQKINADEYVVLDTGEIKQFEKNDNRAENVNSLRKTFRRLRMLINNNFSGSNSEAMLTLTYKENMTDFHRLSKDFANFRHKLNRIYPGFKYIRIAEPQGRGAWHLHVLVKVDNSNFYIKNEKLAQMWGQGFTFVKHLKNVDNVGSYVSAYLADIPVDPKDEVKEGKPKKVIKGGRLHLYPSGMRLYTKSKGIEEPIPYYEKYGKIKNTNLGKKVFSSSKVISDDSGKIITKIKTIQFNLKRK